MGNCMGSDVDIEEVEEKVNFGGGNVQVISSKQAWDEKISDANREGKIVVANFSASWCGPCKIIAPFYIEMSVKYPSLVYLTVDVDHLVEFSTTWDIHATPTFFFLKDGQQLDKLVGANKSELLSKIAKHAEPADRSNEPVLSGT